MKLLNRQQRSGRKLFKDLDIVILRVNGKDLSNATHEETVNSLNTAEEPITVEVLRRSTPAKDQIQYPTPLASSSPVTMTSVATQTDCSSLDSNCCSRMFVVPAPPPLYSSLEEVAALANSTDNLEISGELETDELSYDVEYDLVALRKSSADDRIGLTLCYGEVDQSGVSDVFVGDVEAESIAGKNGRIQAGDQIIKINNKDVRSREEAIRLFSENRADINLLICRPTTLLDQMDDGFLEDCVNAPEEHYYERLFSTRDMKMMPLIEVEEASEFEDTATLPSQKEKEAKDSGVGHESAGSSELECDSSHYDTINLADDTELKSEIVEDHSQFRHQLESRCVDIEKSSFEQFSKEQQCDNNKIFPRMGTKIIHYSSNETSPVKGTCLDTGADTAYNTADSSLTTLELTKHNSGSTLSLIDNKKQKKQKAHENKKLHRIAASSKSLSSSHSDITYTTEDKLAETIAYQQQLLLEQSKNSTLTRENSASQNTINASSNTSNMEWVVKRKPDGTRYVTRRPIRAKILSERKKRLETERCGMTTDDDAMSELKTGRHWSKEDRRRQFLKAREYQQRKAMMQKRIETHKKSVKEDQTNLLELSHKKLQKHTMKDLDFTTVQELLAHQGRFPLSASNLISVTTV